MRIPGETVLDVVKEASAKMSDPSYSQVLVGGFVQEQPSAVKYISAFADELGGAEGVINTIFHASLIALCFQRTNNRSVRTMTFDELNHVAEDDREKSLEKLQPAVLEYLQQNIEEDAMKRVLMLLALAMEWVS